MPSAEESRSPNVPVRVRRVLIAAALLFPAAAVVACGTRSLPADSSAVLLFTGSGTSPNDAAALESILRELQVSYATANSRQLDAMSVHQLTSYRLLIVPGGNFEAMGKGLSAATTANVRQAVRTGLNYLGICAGAFLAGNSPYNGLDLTSGVRFAFHSLEAQGTRKAAVTIAIAGAEPHDEYWEDGPVLTGWGDVVARYPDGTPAIVQGPVGEGWVILTGTHPEAPESWRRGMTFATPAALSRRYAASLVDAALTRKELAHF